MGDPAPDAANGPGRHRATRRTRTRYHDLLSYALDNPIVDALGELLVIGLVVGAYSGLTAIYRYSPWTAVLLIAVISVVVGVGAASLWLRRQPHLSAIERVARAVALGLGVLTVTAAVIIVPVLIIDVALDWFL
jgi:hypothetical protein